LKSPDKQSIRQLAVLGEVQQANKAMFRAFLLKPRSTDAVGGVRPVLGRE
jgi:hypothetical protein